MRYKEIIENAGIDFDMTFDDDTGSFATVTARAQGRTLGSVKFFMDGDTLEADMVEVDERYRGQGIAAAMYDYAKSQGYTVEKSDALTPDGEHFWNKNRGEEAVWEGVNDPHTFKCIFLFGPMGAGKSTVARPLLSHTGLRSVNLDNFNEMFIKKGQVPTGHLAPDQLEKSWRLSQTQQNNFANGRLGVIIDGSGRNPNTAIDVIEKLMPLGYEFMMIFVNVSEATSIARQQSRAAKQQQQWGVGRQVDPTLAKNTYTQVQKNLGRYSAYFGPDRFVYVDNENTPDLTQATKKVDAFLRAPVTRPEALEWIQAQKGGQQVAQQQQKLATAQGRQQQALKQYNPLNPKFTKQGMAENTAAGINKMFNNLGDPVYANLQRVALLAMQGRQQEAQGRLNSVIKDASPQVQKKIIDAVNVIKPVTINGRVADSSTLDKSKAHQDWILNTFIPWVQSLLGQQVAEGSLGNVLPWPEVVNKVNSAMKAMGWKGQRRDDGSFMFSTRGAETDDQYYIVIIDNEGNSMFTYALGTVEDGSPDIGEQDTLPTTEASVSELMNAIRDGFGLNENFADGRNPQDKGDSKRHGVPTKASISTLRKVAKQGGRKGQLAHWMANMKSGRAKAKRK